jgi:HlyD family secretion protein
MISRHLLLRLLLPVLILTLAASAFAYMTMTRAERSKPVAREKVWLVEVQPAEPQSLAPSLTLYGKVETRDLVRAAAPAAGRIEYVHVKPGQRVTRGEQLVVMDQRDFTAALLQAQAEVADIEAQLAELALRHRANQKSVKEEQDLLDLARDEVTRLESLKKRNLASDSALSGAREALGRRELELIAKQLDVDRFEASRKQLQARLARARAQRTQSELAIERSEVIAAFDGIIAEAPVTAGEQVRAGDLLVTLYPLDSLEIRARIPAGFQDEIQQALDETGGLDAMAGTTALQLVRLAGQADPSGIDGFFRLRHNSHAKRIGNLVRIELQRPLASQVIALPFRAIYGNSRVFLNRNGRMQGVDVESVGQARIGDETRLLIRNPLIKPGDEIVITHLPNAVDGLKIRTGPEDDETPADKPGKGKGKNKGKDHATQG